MTKTKWTADQKKAIAERNRNVVVTASAGTGKTAVLSGRCVDLISDKTCCDINNILVLTFTDLAAAEMRSRIADQLRNAYLASGEKHLRSQIISLPAANISTMHSFCKKLIEENFHTLNIEPAFTVLDSDEQLLVKSEILQAVIDWAWHQKDIRDTIEILFSKRDINSETGFLSNIIKINDFLASLVSRNRWLERSSTNCNLENLKQIVKLKLSIILEKLNYCSRILKKLTTDTDKTSELIDELSQYTAECTDLIDRKPWDDYAEKIKKFVKPRTKISKLIDEDTANIINDITKTAINDLMELNELAAISSDHTKELRGRIDIQTKTMIELVRKFDALYSERKRSLNCMDFTDLEHYALRLLSNGCDNRGKLIASETAVMLQNKFKYVFIDEYQDINPVQQAILDLLTGSANVFYVGDIKQSIYGFRGTGPESFIEQLRSAANEPSGDQALRIDLNRNFRSSEVILNFANSVFERTMTDPFASVDYDESAALKPGKNDMLLNGAVELHILNDGAPTGLQDEQRTPISVTKRQKQAALIAKRIRQMVGADGSVPQFEIFDKELGHNRPVRYSDIVILMRSPSIKVQEYVEILRMASIPVSCPAAGGYFDATEIRDCLCLLKVLDNMQRDIELASVLRGPFFKITNSDLAKIKFEAAEDTKNYYEAVNWYTENGSNKKLRMRLNNVIKTLKQWRSIGSQGHIADLIWLIYRQTGFLSFVSGLENGSSKRANLIKLHDKAVSFENFISNDGHASLKRFIDFIEKFEDATGQWSSAEPDSSLENSVRIMSIHKSKGLEFGVVILAEISSPFRKQLDTDCIFDSDYGLGLTVIDESSNCKLSSAQHRIILEKKAAQTAAEEMRILYVAMTRAKERLILTASPKFSQSRKTLCKGSLSDPGQISHWLLREAKTHLDWILYALSEHKSLHKAFGTHLEGTKDSNFELTVYDPQDCDRLGQYIQDMKNNMMGTAQSSQKDNSAKLLKGIKNSLEWQYPYKLFTEISAKSSVTELTHNSDEFTDTFNLERPVTLGPDNETVDNRFIGSAVHLVIAKLNLERFDGPQSVRTTIDELVNNGSITSQIAQHIDAGSIAGFFKSQLGRLALEKNSVTHREWIFTFAKPAIEDHGDEKIVVQGIIDLIIERSDGLHIVDFKTDYVTEKTIEKRADIYRGQLDIYAQAAKTILDRPVKGSWLYFLKTQNAVQIR